MNRHAFATLFLTVVLALLLFFAGIPAVLNGAACVAFIGVRNDI